MTDSSFECNHEKIKAVDDAFDAAWAFIQTNYPKRDLKYDCERMTALSTKDRRAFDRRHHRPNRA